MPRREPRRDDGEQKEELDERVVAITRVAKVIKGGRRFAFRVVAVVGDNRGHVGVGVGKARGVPDAIRKATDRARRNMGEVAIIGTTIPHEVKGDWGGAKVFLKPASPGTGVIAAGGVRAVLEAAGIHDILTKSLGSSNVLNATHATLAGLQRLKRAEQEARARGKDAQALQPFWRRSRPGAPVEAPAAPEASPTGTGTSPAAETQPQQEE